MNVVHTVAPGDFGGLEDVVVRLAGGFVRRGHRVSIVGVVNALDQAAHFFDTATGEGIDVHRVIVPERAYAREVAQVRAIFHGIAPDLVHTHGYRPDVLHASAARRAALPLVTTLHGFTGGGMRNRMYEWLQVRSARRHQAVVAVSAPMAETLRRRGVPDRILHVIPNAWEPRSLPEAAQVARAALGVAEGAFHVGWVGRLSQEKGPDLFLEALAHLGDRRITASVIGDGPLRNALVAKARELGLTSLRFHGAIQDARRFFRGFDAFVLSSRTEGTPIALFEAMFTSTPVVATAVGGVPAVVSSESALLVPAEDPSALAAAIRSVQDDPGAAARRAGVARTILRERFAEDPWLSRYEKLYDQVVRFEGV